jgi:DNA-3-methyladenine glycosylase II
MKLHSVILESAAAPFDLRHSLKFIESFAPTEGEQGLTAESVSKAVMVDQMPILFQVTSNGDALKCALCAEAALDEDRKTRVIDRIRFYLSLDDDLTEFYRVGLLDPHFRPVISRLFGYHQVKFLTPFENACWAVLTQRNRLPAAQAMKMALVDSLGAWITFDGARYPAFPDPAAIYEAGVGAVEKLIEHAQKARYLINIAAAFREVDEAFLRTGPYADVEAWLTGIKGIGPWSASFVLVRGLGRMENLPTESRLLEAASRCYQRPVDEATLRELAAPYGSWSGYWAHYLRVAA